MPGMLLKSMAVAGLLLGAMVTGLPPVPAAAQTTEAEIVRARTTQLYLHAEDGLRDLFEAQTAFDRARTAGDDVGMRFAAAQMLAGSTTAAFWSVILDERVKELGARQEVLDLTAELREITLGVHDRLRPVAATGDMAALGRGLDNSADNITQLRAVVKGIYDVITANVTGQ